MKQKIKKYYFLSGLILLLIILIFSAHKIARAEDDDEREHDDEKNFQVIDTNPDTSAKPQKTEYKTVYTKLSDTVSQQTIATIRHDSDGDGLYDDVDPHPTINENFIVKDDNLNGIDDRYEQ